MYDAFKSYIFLFSSFALSIITYSFENIDVLTREDVEPIIIEALSISEIIISKIIMEFDAQWNLLVIILLRIAIYIL